MLHGRRVLFVLALCLVGVLATASAAVAAGGKVRAAAVFGPDVYESDEGTANAKGLPETSIHTFETSSTDGYTHDEDWYKFTAETTGQPFILDGQFIDAQPNFDPAAEIWKLNPEDGTIASVRSNDDWDSDWGWRASMFPRFFFKAPSPGTYFVELYQDDSPESPGMFKVFYIAGDARRVAGATRYDTAAEVGRELYPDADNIRDSDPEGPRNIIVATGVDYPDALASVPFAVQQQLAIQGEGISFDYRGAVILLTKPTALPAATRAEIERLASQNYWYDGAYDDPGCAVHVYVLGGPETISDEVYSEIAGIRGISSIQRIAGKNRFATAADLADLTAEKASDPGYIYMSNTVYLVNGYSYADALSAGPVAGFDESPILLTKQLVCPSETIDWMKANGTSQVVAIGSTKTISDAVLDQIKAEIPSIETTRVGGDDRYETSYLLGKWGVDRGMEGSSSVLVTGEYFPDGLTGGVICANDGAPLLLTKPGTLSPYVEQFHQEYGGFDNSGILVGGSASVSDGVYQAYRDLWN